MLCVVAIRDPRQMMTTISSNDIVSGRCGVCCKINSESLPIYWPGEPSPFSWNRKDAAGRISISHHGSRDRFIGFRRSNRQVWTLKETAAAGCELCQLIWRSLAYQCPSEKAERALETFNGELTIYSCPGYLKVNLSFFMRAKVLYYVPGQVQDSRKYLGRKLNTRIC